MVKLPPATDSETAVLASVLIDGEVLADVLEVLPRPEMFGVDKHRHVYTAMSELYGRNAPVDTDTILAELDRQKTKDAVGASFLAELIGRTATAANATYHAEIVAQKFIERKIYHATIKVQKRIQDGETDGLSDWAGEAIYDAGRVDPPTPPLWKQVNEALRLDEEGMRRGITGHSWGLSKLNYYSGGIRPGKTIVLAALKKAGKTKFLIHAISQLLLDDVPVLFFSLEMRATAVLNWLVSTREGINSAAFESDRLTGEELERTSQCLAEIAEQNKLVIHDRSFLTLERIRQEIRREVQRRGVEVVVLDFIQRVNVEQRRGENRAVALQHFAYRLADVGRDYNVGIILAAQLSNEAERSGSPHMGLIKESGGIAEAADTIIFLNNKNRTKHKTTLNLDSKIEIDLIIEGQRNGVSGMRIPMKADLRYGRFHEEKG